jgi:hypothetical protein
MGALSYRRILVTEESGGGGLSLRSHNLDSVGELYAEDDFFDARKPPRQPVALCALMSTHALTKAPQMRGSVRLRITYTRQTPNR